MEVKYIMQNVFLFIEAELLVLFWYLSYGYIHYSFIKRKLEQERKHLKCSKNSGLVTNRKVTQCSDRVDTWRRED